jgi:hypothetical protein
VLGNVKNTVADSRLTGSFGGGVVGMMHLLFF